MNIQHLSLDERLEPVEDIWDSIAAEQGVLPVTPEQREDLDPRLDTYRLDGNRGTPAVEA